MSALVVLEPGLCTTIQDGGRRGYQALAVPVCGARDAESLRLANALAGNPADMAALEISVVGPCCEVKGGPVRLAVAGAEGYLEILSPAPRRIRFGQSVSLAEGSVFRVREFSGSFGVVLAVTGGFALPAVLGSLSTCLAGGFGGFRGRALRKGDELPLVENGLCGGAERLLPDNPFQPADAAEGTIIRVVPGPQQEYFTDESLAAFYRHSYRLSASSDRMGLRLEGPRLFHSEKGFNLVSDGIVTGAIQVPGNGQPIILFNDHQLTGGYPKIATVISADLAKLGRVTPGGVIRFQPVSVAVAENIRCTYEKMLRQLEQSIVCFAQEKEAMAIRLGVVNLIDGIGSF